MKYKAVDVFVDNWKVDTKDTIETNKNIRVICQVKAFQQWT